MQVTITMWQFVPPEADEEPGMPTYRLAGLADDKPFCGDMSVEIDGRDAEYEPIWGFDLRDDFDMWNALWPALEKADGWNADMEARAAEYYGEDNRT